MEREYGREIAALRSDIGGKVSFTDDGWMECDRNGLTLVIGDSGCVPLPAARATPALFSVSVCTAARGELEAVPIVAADQLVACGKDLLDRYAEHALPAPVLDFQRRRDTR